MARKYREAKVNIKKFLKSKQISQYELAKRLKVPPDYVTRLLQRTNPTLKTLNSVAKALDCKLSDLIDE